MARDKDNLTESDTWLTWFSKNFQPSLVRGGEDTEYFKLKILSSIADSLEGILLELRQLKDKT